MKICSLSANFEQDLKLYRNCQRIRNSLYLRILTSKQKQTWLINHSLLGYLLASRYKFGIPDNSLEVSHNAQSLIKNFLGFFGMYCINDILDLVPVLIHRKVPFRWGHRRKLGGQRFSMFSSLYGWSKSGWTLCNSKIVETSKCFWSCF